MNPTERWAPIAVCYQGRMLWTGNAYVDLHSRIPRFKDGTALDMWDGPIGFSLKNGGRIFYIAEVRGVHVYDVKDPDDASRPMDTENIFAPVAPRILK